MKSKKIENIVNFIIKIEDIVDFIIGQGELTIKTKIYRVIFFVCIILIVVFGLVTLVSIYSSRDFAVAISNSIGNEALEKSSAILREQRQADLLYRIGEKSKYIKSNLYDSYTEMILMKRELDNLYKHPEYFKPRTVHLGRDFQEGDVAALRYAPFVNVEDLNREPLKQEIELLGNLQDLFYFLSLKYRNPNFFDAPTFGILTESGIGIMADSAVTVEQWRTSNDNADFWNHAVYQRTKAAWLEGKRNEPIYTISYSEGINSKIGMFSCSIPYEVDGKFAGIILYSMLAEELNYLVEPSSEDDESINFILNDEGEVLLSSNKSDSGDLEELKVVYDNPPDIPKMHNSELSAVAKKMVAGEEAIEEISINGQQYYIAYAPIKELNWSLGVLMPVTEVTEIVEENKNIIQNLTEENVQILEQRFLILVFFLIAFTLIIWAGVTGIGRKLADEFVEPIYELADGVKDIASGNLDRKIEIRTKDEIAHLATSFNTMTDELKIYMANLQKITAEEERIHTELEVAKNIQESFLPNNFNFNRSDFEIYATMHAAKEVGGDFYDFYLLDEDHLVVTIADVSGKGIPGALFMMMSKTILKNFTTLTTNPDDFSAVLSHTNNQLCQNNEEFMFVTVFFGVLELSTGKFIFVNGGHNAPVIYRKKDNHCEFLEVVRNFVLGGVEDVDYKQQEIYLESGDLIFMYTDGVNEAMNEEYEEYTSPRLLNFMKSTDLTADLQAILKAVRADVAKHVGKAEQSDDITMLALRFNSKRAKG